MTEERRQTGEEEIHFIDSHAHLDLVLGRLGTSNPSRKDFTDFFAAHWTDELIGQLFAARKGS